MREAKLAHVLHSSNSMPDPIVVPAAMVLTGGGLVARDYLKRRLQGSEDRYMAMYGKTEWSSSNMDLLVQFDPSLHAEFVEAFLRRVDARLDAHTEDTRLFREDPNFDGDAVEFRERAHVSAQALVEPRRGVHFDVSEPGTIRVVWNHMQTDGVGMWSALRPLFDTNPPLISYRDIPAPPPLLPELLALPSFTRRLTWRGKLGPSVEPNAPLSKRMVRWDAVPIRALKSKIGGSFNLVTSALAVHQVFQRHPDKRKLNVGLIAYFPFLQGRNKYGVFLCKVRRGDVASIVKQLGKQTQSMLLNWGRQSAQSYALGRLPDRAFSKLVSYYRRQVDVLVSSLPVGQNPISLAGIPATIACHPRELTVPYYFLLVGTRHELHVSYTSRFRQDPRFMELEPVIPLQSTPVGAPRELPLSA